MATLTGSTNLNEEQRAFYTHRYGLRYVAVQQTPFTFDETGKVWPRASRAERRRMRFKPRAGQ
jgi:hypothetical protein